uniref:Uncharacterized protein n=1 Tax=Rhizophora mucronata TaxID=61149 RepID=A0A2P2QBA4_RHIMU
MLTGMLCFYLDKT